MLFHAREDKPVWQAHFERLRLPVGDWRAADGVFLVESAEVVEPWHRATPRQRPRRTLRLEGEPMRGIPAGPGDEVSAVYADPPPPGVTTLPGHANARSSATVAILEAVDRLAENGRLHQTLLVEELQPKDGGDHRELPVALVPSKVLSTRPIDEALAEVAQRVVDAGDDLPRTAGIDLLARRLPPAPRRGAAARSRRRDDPSPRRHRGRPARHRRLLPRRPGPARHGQDLRRLPGHRPARARARLGRRRHLAGAQGDRERPARRRRGRGARRAGRQGDPRPRAAPPGPPCQGRRPRRVRRRARARRPGYVVGGTAWDLTSTRRVGRGQLDLVVVDEAGQFSLAKTLACSVAGDRLLLLGDPQQLPQVSQGTHPDPVDASALGWLIGDEPVLPAELGYFLETTWRMHPALTEPVSRLSYAGQLRSEATVTAARPLDGVEPGLHVRLVDHHDNSTWSPEEAVVVRDLVHDLLGRTWHDPQERGPDGAPVGPRPLGPADVIVITPYNGQVGQLRRTLDDAGLADVPVGTVDKFQGQEAAVAILSLAASSHSDVSRGHGLPARPAPAQRGDLARPALRLRRAVLVLTDFAPRTPAELIDLGAFLGLCAAAATTASAGQSEPVPA